MGRAVPDSHEVEFMNKLMSDLERPMSEWLTIFNAEDYHLKPSLASALIGKACMLGEDEGLFSHDEASEFMMLASEKDFVPTLALLTVVLSDHPDTGDFGNVPSYVAVCMAVEQIISTAREKVEQ